MYFSTPFYWFKKRFKKKKIRSRDVEYIKIQVHEDGFT